MNGKSFSDSAKNKQVAAMLVKTGLNNVLLPTLFTVVSDVVQRFYFRFRKNNIKGITKFSWKILLVIAFILAY